MRRLFPDPKVKRLYEDDFGENDLLHRKQTGDALSDLLNRFEEPLVVALDSQWGSGKTWFLQRWVGEHDKANKNSIVLYFDAFAHDHVSDPLPALVSELEGRTKDKDTFQEIKKVALKVVLAGARVGAAVTTSGLSEAGAAVANTLTGEAEKHLEEYWKQEAGRNEAMKEFREALKSLTSEENGKKIIIVIDELDRCRPDYALEVLEVIKHFFSVDNVHFVLGVNLKALENMVRVRYGQTEVNEAITYLEKFIRIKLELPEAVSEDDGSKQNALTYLDHLCQEMRIPDHIGTKLKEQVRLVSYAHSISLRQIEHIISAVLLASNIVLATPRIIPGRITVMNDLIITKIVRPDLHQKFLDATITANDLDSYLGQPNDYTERNERERIRNIWLFISQNEVMDGAKMSSIGRRLIHPEFIPQNLSEYHLKELPKDTQRKFLDLFQFYKSSPE